MALSGAEIKRQILMSAGSSPIRKKIEQAAPGISEGEMIEWGNDLDAVTRLRGWALIESYMLRRMDLVGLAMSDSTTADQKGIARGFIELMQWIHLTIKKRDEIIDKERLKNEAKNVPQNEGNQGI